MKRWQIPWTEGPSGPRFVEVGGSTQGKPKGEDVVVRVGVQHELWWHRGYW